MSKINKDKAIKEFNKWLDGKKVKESKREALQSSADVIVDAIMVGQAVIDDQANIVYKLDFPLTNKEGVVSVESLKFKQRISLKELKDKLRGINSTDSDDRLTAYISAITDNHNNVINGLDTNDLTFCQNVASYFL